jgi:hypothetical protein
MKPDEQMRPDVQAYMIQAAIEIANKANFTPASEAEMEEWLVSNREAICKRSIELQWDLLNKLVKNGNTKRVGLILCAQVWKTVNIEQIRKQTEAMITEAIR